MTRWFEAHTIARFGRYRQVEPTVVVEIALRRHHALEPPPVGLLAALPADRRPAAGQAARRDRHARDGDGAVRGPPARGRAPGDRRRAASTEPPAEPIVRLTGAARGRYASAHVRRHRRRAAHGPLTLYTDAFIDPRHDAARRQRRLTDILNEADDRLPRARRRHLRRVRCPRHRRCGPTTPRSTSARSCSPSLTRRSSASPSCGPRRCPRRR